MSWSAPLVWYEATSVPFEWEIRSQASRVRAEGAPFERVLIPSVATSPEGADHHARGYRLP